MPSSWTSPSAATRWNGPIGHERRHKNLIGGERVSGTTRSGGPGGPVAGFQFLLTAYVALRFETGDERYA